MPAEPDRAPDAVRAGAAVGVRPAEPDDAERLLAWANDPLTRAAGFHPQPIVAAEHHAWLAERLASPSSRLYIGMAVDEPVGQVRFERDDQGVVEVSIAVAPAARGRGLGRRLLAAALATLGADPSFPATAFVARIRPDNVASLRLFAGAGFRESGRTQVNGQDCVILRRD